MRIYVASSWANRHQQEVVAALRRAGHEAYDFRHPDFRHPDGPGFSWADIDDGWEDWSCKEYVFGLFHPIAGDGFVRDFNAMLRAEAFVLVTPCGRSAHLELGWATGRGVRSYILLLERQEPELMYRLADRVVLSVDDLLVELNDGGAPW